MTQRQNAQSVIVAHSEWLAGLRLISRKELIPGVITVVLSLVAAVVCFASGEWLNGIFVVAGHVLLIMMCATCIVRSYHWVGQGVLLISALHVFAFATQQAAGWRLLGFVYIGLGIISLIPLTICRSRMMQRWHQIGNYDERDDFRWLITRAPFFLRYRVLQIVQGIRGGAN